MTQEHKALAMIQAYQSKHGTSPTGTELAKHLKVSRATAYNILNRMEREGLIERPHNMGAVRWSTHRSIRLTSAAMKALTETM